MSLVADVEAVNDGKEPIGIPGADTCRAASVTPRTLHCLRVPYHLSHGYRASTVCIRTPALVQDGTKTLTLTGISRILHPRRS